LANLRTRFKQNLKLFKHHPLFPEYNCELGSSDDIFEEI